MKRHLRCLYDSARGEGSRSAENEEMNKKLHAQNCEIINLLKSATCNLLKDAVDIYQYFPAKSNNQIQAFLADDGNFEKRRRALEHHLICVTETDQKRGRFFSDALINLLFSKEMIFSKKWPVSQ